MKIQGKKDCVSCGEEFEYKNNIKIYCSKKCKRRGYYLKYEKKEITKKRCIFCKESFMPNHNGQKYCSIFCYGKDYRKKHKKIKKIMEAQKCINCDEDFVPIHGLQKYCSQECRTIDYKNKNKERIKKWQERWYKNNKEGISEKSKENYKINKKEIDEKNKKWREDNREKARESDRIYSQNHKEKRRESYKKNKEREKERSRRWWIENKDKRTEEDKEKARERSRKHSRKMRKENPMYKLNRNMSTGISKSLKPNNLFKNGKHWETLVINTKKEIMEHLEKNFLPGMSWKNYGIDGWHIHHIVPLSFFEFTSTDDVEFKYCWSIDNLLPLWAKDNDEKRDKIILWGKEINARNINRDYFNKLGKKTGLKLKQR